ncbi:hypothetical protein J2T02_005714 [Chitinophaga terrae (ex Kim and Jung 2007)]|uniref:hypothetical protein n=1 Tax=Chitinophaga terrae (ex Kim and Jung 2007) TaxID=408074 RepID=UPI00277FD64E|nr:hypothetical protein [Chitinophaga terrae (ex Kim and Jung 2007)]MDQ0110561.1 hypothetical protein [Chitinophaga terrae (ex Kim and Jung 2007)]
MERKNISRNLDIELMFFDSRRLAEFQHVLMSSDQQRMIALLDEMNKVLEAQKVVSDSEDIAYKEVLGYDTLFRESSIETYEYIQQSYWDKKQLIKTPAFEILQYAMLYACSAINREKFYYNLFYNPPIQLTFIFAEFYDKWNDAASFAVETFNPYAPYCNDPGIEEGIHYIIVTDDMLKSFIENLGMVRLDGIYAGELENDYLFLEQAFGKAREHEWKIVVRIAP